MYAVIKIACLIGFHFKATYKSPGLLDNGNKPLLFLLGLFVKSIYDAHHDVAGNDISVILPAAAAVHADIDIRQVSQYIPGIDHQAEAVLHEILGESGVPHEVVAVHGV